MSKAYNYTNDKATTFHIVLSVLSIITLCIAFIVICINKDNEEPEPEVQTIFYVCDHCYEPAHIPITDKGEIIWP